MLYFSELTAAFDLPGEDLTLDQLEFALAMDRYKRRWCRPEPSWHEVLAVLVALGYRKSVVDVKVPRPPSE